MLKNFKKLAVASTILISAISYPVSSSPEITTDLTDVPFSYTMNSYNNVIKYLNKQLEVGELKRLNDNPIANEYETYQAYGNFVILKYHLYQGHVKSIDAIIEFNNAMREDDRGMNNEHKLIIALLNAAQNNMVYDQELKEFDTCVDDTIANNKGLMYSQYYNRTYIVTKDYIQNYEININDKTARANVIKISVIARR